jgi:DNA-directed RNA polymerase subunit RPC12/RpoP
MNENRHPWTSDEKTALFAAVEQYRATGGQLDWHVIAAAVPGRSAQAAQALYYRLHSVHTLDRIRTPAAPVSPRPSTLRRMCLRCRLPFDSLDRKRNWICGSCNERIAAVGSAMEHAAHTRAA